MRRSGAQCVPPAALGQKQLNPGAAAFLQRYSNTLVLNYSKTNGPAASSFADYSQLSAYARDPMNFCTKRYLFQGSKESGKLYLKPKAKLTRAEAGQVLYACSCVATRTK